MNVYHVQLDRFLMSKRCARNARMERGQIQLRQFVIFAILELGVQKEPHFALDVQQVGLAKLDSPLVFPVQRDTMHLVPDNLIAFLVMLELMESWKIISPLDVEIVQQAGLVQVDHNLVHNVNLDILHLVPEQLDVKSAQKVQ